MDAEREKMIRDVWARHRSRLMPQLRRDGVVRCTEPVMIKSYSAVIGGDDGGEAVTAKILVFEARLPPGAQYLNSFPGVHDRTPGKVVCEGIELEEIP